MNKFFFSILLVVITGTSFYVSPILIVSAQNNTTEDIGASTPKISNPFNNPKLSVTLPGLNFRKPTCTDTECSTPWLADYILALYKYGIGIIGIIAAVVLMIAGIIWLTAGGNSERVGEAKKWISGSIFGVFIAFTSYLILQFVNPALTELSPLKISYIAKIDLSQIIPPSEIQPTSPTAPRGNGAGTYKVPILYQYDYGSQIASTGCGPTSLTMVLNYYSINKSVTDVAAETNKAGDYSYSAGWGNGMPGFDNILKKNNLKTKYFQGGSIDDALSLLQYGPVIVSMTSVSPSCKCVFPRGNAHYVVFTGYENGTVYTNDPNPNNHSRSWEGQVIDTAKLDINTIKKCCKINAGSITAYK